MKKRTYLGLVFHYTFRRSIVLTDRAAILIGPLVTSYFSLRGGPMPEGLDGLIAIGVVITAGAALLARFVSAPFVIWKRDQSQIKRMQSELDRPVRRLREAAQEHKIALRRELGDCIARIIAYVEMTQISDIFLGEQAKFTKVYRDDILRSREIINALSYDVVLRVCCLNIIELCTKLASRIDTKHDISGLLDRLWAQRKLTFRLLHHDFPNDALALAQIENLIEEHGETFRPHQKAEGEAAELEDEMAEFRQLLRKYPDLAGKLEARLESGDSDGL